MNEVKLLRSILQFFPFSRTFTLTSRSSVDEVSLLLAVTVFILHCPKHVVCSPNVAYPAINAFTQCFQSESGAVRHRDAISANNGMYCTSLNCIVLEYTMRIVTPVIK